MSRINQPINQVRLTNVAVIKYNYKGKRFEVACYKNKIIDYRAGLETDLSEVLQSDNIFVNVGKGEFAKTSDLVSVFGTKDKLVIAKIILEKGNSVHVSDLERTNILEQTQQKIAVWLSENCVNVDTNLPYTVHQMKQALSNYTIQSHKPIKVQYLDAFKFIKYTKKYSIERCMMELLFHYPTSHDGTVQQFIENKNQDQIDTIRQGEKESGATTTQSTTGSTTASVRLPIQIIQPTKGDEGSTETILTLHVDPSLYRDLLALATDIPQGRIEITVHTVGGCSTSTAATTTTTTSTAGINSTNTSPIISELSQTETLATATEDRNHGDNSEDDSYVHITESMAKVRIDDKNENVGPAVDKDGSKDEADEDEEDHSDSSGNDVDERMLLMNKKQLKKARKAKNREIIKIKKTVDHDDDDDEGDDNDDYDENDNDNEDNEINNSARNKNNKKSSRKNNKKNNSKVQPSITQSQLPKQQQQLSTTETAPTMTGGNGNNATGQTCNTCGGNFVTPAAYRAHFRSDWHRFNQKLKLQGSQPISEEEFLCDASSFFAMDS